ncbi:hypothetical protein SAMN05216516_103272 [Izhakiella capsodis]|uniref:Uncharacterized protein n=1 Tax=Izhakiella capsodis TaxID=1367852 RepID=A0A1I4X4S3_9GAMM|nr:hypothetical protein [Izhakiella capsodis]SFN20406.1 hypothetical protein SAMN05216516_103272 [Izhakiella capsodis]
MTLPISNFDKILDSKLTLELSDKKTAETLEPYISDKIFTFTPKEMDICAVDNVIAFAFGNRPNASDDKNALAEPGPMNKELADCCADLYRKKRVPMFMQWEIARYFEAGDYPDIPSCDVNSIEPYWNEKGELIYLSTDGVVESIITTHFKNNPSALGCVAVIGHRDHVKRCIMTCENRKLAAYAPKNLRLPGWYDEKSWQLWTRRRDLYVLMDISSQLSMQAQINIGKTD